MYTIQVKEFYSWQTIIVSTFCEKIFNERPS